MLDSISPIDGRYEKITEPLKAYFSEFAFMKYRVLMEEEFLKAFKKAKFKSLAKNFSLKDAEEIKKIEATTNHDLKAIEYWMRSKLPKELGNWIHFGLTSQDATNIAQALMVQDALREVIVPAIESIHLPDDDVPMLARTHGQPASPTTFGKEMAVFRSRISRQLKQLKNFKLTAKFNGATGNYNALVVAYPKIDWIAFSKKFITSLGLEPNLITTQIESYDNMAELFDTMRRLNTILMNLDQDMWRYISDEWVVQEAVKGEVGSSTMPHKINPIQFENSEGNLGIANALFVHFSQKLPISRLQRDLTDSTVIRNIGVAFAHSLIGYVSLQKGLERLSVHKQKMTQVLESHPEVLAEAIQTILRREGIPMPYEKLKELTRGREVTMEDISNFIDTLDVSERIKTELHKLSPTKYTGIASRLSKYV